MCLRKCQFGGKCQLLEGSYFVLKISIFLKLLDFFSFSWKYFRNKFVDFVCQHLLRFLHCAKIMLHTSSTSWSFKSDWTRKKFGKLIELLVKNSLKDWSTYSTFLKLMKFFSKTYSILLHSWKRNFKKKILRSKLMDSSYSIE